MEIAQPAFDAISQAMQNAIVLYGAITVVGMVIAAGVRTLVNKVEQFFA